MAADRDSQMAGSGARRGESVMRRFLGVNPQGVHGKDRHLRAQFGGEWTGRVAARLLS